MGADIHGRLQVRYPRSKTWIDRCAIEDSRNYRVFAALAGVRNYWSINPISEPRGLPDDLPRVWCCSDHGWSTDDPDCSNWCHYGDHSFSWLTLDEILSWEGWDQTLRDEGWLDRSQYVAWVMTGGVPKSWCGFVTGLNVIHADFDAESFPEGWTHIRVRWNSPLRDSCAVFLAWMEYARLLTGNAEARIVFGFDS